LKNSYFFFFYHILFVSVEDYFCTWSHSTAHTSGSTPLDEGSTSHKYIYLTTHIIHSSRTSMPSARFELAIPASKRPQTYALDPAAIGIAKVIFHVVKIVHYEIVILCNSQYE
jgi:hypothetical protein